MKEQIEKLLDKTNVKLYDITNINYNPHPYTITPNHINIAQNFGGMLGESVLNHPESKCGVKGCTLNYNEHTSDKVVALQLSGNVSNNEMNRILKLIVSEIGEGKFDGFVFIESKFKILENE